MASAALREVFSCPCQLVVGLCLMEGDFDPFYISLSCNSDPLTVHKRSRPVLNPKKALVSMISCSRESHRSVTWWVKVFPLVIFMVLAFQFL